MRKKDGAPDQGRSRNPRNGANRTAPGRRPLRGAVEHCLCWIQRPEGRGLRVLGKQLLAHASFGLSARQFAAEFDEALHR